MISLKQVYVSKRLNLYSQITKFLDFGNNNSFYTARKVIHITQ